MAGKHSTKQGSDGQAAAGGRRRRTGPKRSDRERGPLWRRVVIGTAALVVAMAALVGLFAWDPHMPWNERINSFDAVYSVNADGSVDVTETIEWHFGRGTHHGINRDIVTRQAEAVEGTSGRYYDMTDSSAESPSGAPADLDEVSLGGGLTRLRIGDPYTEVGGTQTYVVRYRLADVINTVADPDGQHVELYWNVVGLQTDIPADRVTITVTGPGDVIRAACYRGVQGSTERCDSRAGDRATFAAQGLGPRSGVTVAASFDPAGFTDPPAAVPPELVAPAPSTPFATTFLAGLIGVAALLPFLAGAILLLLRLTVFRDRQYVGTTPGLVPSTSAGPDPTGPASDVVAVRFTPPDGLTPALAGLIDDTVADHKELTATVIDLAARGWLTIAEQSHDSWRLTLNPQPPNEELLTYERLVIAALFPLGRGTVTLDNRPDATRAKGMGKARKAIYKEGKARHWFHVNPSERDSTLRKVTWLLYVGGALALFLGWGFRTFIDLPAGHRGILPGGVVLAVSMILTGLVVTRLGVELSGRTPLGTAAEAQTRGYRLYLSKAEASQIRFEEAADIFTRNLPYAIIFGLATKWAKVFKEVVAAAEQAGQHIAVPTWYVGSSGNPLSSLDSVGSAASSFTSATSHTIDAPASSGSSGGGGSSGGSSGGGGGGGGSSSW